MEYINNMTTSKELELMGINISKNYLTNNVSLNDGLKKVASEKGLNKNQIKRVAESANVNTYLEMFKTAKDKYLTYELADASKVYDELFKTASIQEEEYIGYIDPKGDISVEDIFNLYKKSSNMYSEEVLNNIVNTRANLEKNSNFKAKSNHLEGVSNYLNSKFTEKLGDFDFSTINLTKMVKQAVLSGIPFGDIENLIKTASPTLGDTQIEYLKSKLSNINLENSNTSQIPNPESSLYKIAEQIEEDFLYLNKVEEAYDFYKNEYDTLRKENNAPNMLKHAGFFDSTGNVFKWFKEHPKTSAALALLVSYKVGKAVEKSKQQNEKVPLTKEEIRLKLNRYRGM